MNDPILVIVFRIFVCLSAIVVLLPVIVTFVFFPKNTKVIHFDVYLVLGAAPTKQGTLSKMMRSRIDEVVQQYRHCPRPIIISGGTPYSHVSEARTMADYAIDQGIDVSHLLLEEKANNTYENFKFAKEIMLSHGFERCCIVTNDFHMRRAAFFARKFDIQSMCAPAYATELGVFYHRYIGVLECFLRIRCIMYEALLSIQQ